MRRSLLAILLVPVLGGCLGARASRPVISRAPPASAGPLARYVREWNGPANADVRAAATPPRGPYPWYGHRPIQPQGSFEAFVGAILTLGRVGNLPPPCAVYFWFPRGYHGRAALVTFAEVDVRRGIYGRPSVQARKAMIFHTGPVYAEDMEGRLYPTGTSPTS
jgi:hypothetical protein